MNRSRLQVAKRDIVQHFDDLSQKILKLSEIKTILTDQRAYWRLAQRANSHEFIRFLTENAKLKRLDFPFPYRKEYRYTWGNVPLLEVLLTLKPGSYFTHYTAVRINGLTEQVPKTIYLNHEQRPHHPNGTLEQASIDRAFKRAQRTSQNVVKYGDLRICLINGMHTQQLGVTAETVEYDASGPAKVRVTNIERTLIDITVRPVYAGGVAQVLKAFELAKDRVSVNRLMAMLQKLSYVYPYHQAIGFYLERAGYKSSSIELLRRAPMNFDFYLAHHMGPTTYVKQWRLYVPKGF